MFRFMVLNWNFSTDIRRLRTARDGSSGRMQPRDADLLVRPLMDVINARRAPKGCALVCVLIVTNFLDGIVSCCLIKL
jgi:hypothetical protein